MMAGAPVSQRPENLVDDSDSDDGGERLRPENCYDTAEMRQICANWKPSMPDYVRAKEVGIAGAGDTTSRDYVEDLRKKFRLSKERNLFRSSFVADTDTQCVSFVSPRVKNKHSNFSKPALKLERPTSSGDNSNNSSLQPASAESAGKNESSGEDLNISPDADVGSGFESEKSNPKPTVLERIIESIEMTIQEGNRSFVRGSVHPQQTNLNILRLNRRSGYSNLFTSEDYLALIPRVSYPSMGGWDDDATIAVAVNQ